MAFFYWLNLKQKRTDFTTWTVIVAITTYATRNFSVSHLKAPLLPALAFGAFCCFCGKQPEAGNPQLDFTLPIFLAF